MNTARPLPRVAHALFLTIVVALAAACGGGSAPSGPPAASPTPSAPAVPTPSPIVIKVETPEDAAALVVATDQRFASVPKLNPDLIGASAWWTSEPRNGGGFVITITIGWGDCPAGCISRHVWAFDVTGDGQVILTDETGDPMPAGQVQP